MFYSNSVTLLIGHHRKGHVRKTEFTEVLQGVYIVFVEMSLADDSDSSQTRYIATLLPFTLIQTVMSKTKIWLTNHQNGTNKNQQNPQIMNDDRLVDCIKIKFALSFTRIHLPLCISIGTNQNRQKSIFLFSHFNREHRNSPPPRLKRCNIKVLRDHALVEFIWRNRNKIGFYTRIYCSSGGLDTSYFQTLSSFIPS